VVTVFFVQLNFFAGVADTQFKLEASHVLGSQKDGLNSSYFFQVVCRCFSLNKSQGAIRKLQMGGEREIRDGVLPIAEKDYIGSSILLVQLKFFRRRSRFRYEHNTILQ
jgi:hypothetical protein